VKSGSPTAHLAVLFAAVLGSCASPPRIAPGATLEAGLSALGTVEVSPPGGPEARGTIVVLADLHPLHGGILRSRDEFYGVRRDLGEAVAWLVEQHFALLGCEWKAGPLPKDATALAHRAAYARAIQEHDDVNAWTLYQPIRLEQEFRSRLLVVGVEDPELYDRDVARLRELRELATDEQPTPEIVIRKRRLEAAIRAQSNARGERAAEILVQAMESRGFNRAALLLGRAHTAAAVKALSSAGYRVLRFESHAVRAWIESKGRSGRVALALDPRFGARDVVQSRDQVLGG
jgi:hypothetical protein